MLSQFAKCSQLVSDGSGSPFLRSEHGSLKLIRIAALALLAASFVPGTAAGADDDLAVTVFYGILDNNIMWEMARLDSDLNYDYHLAALTLSKKLSSWRRYMDIEGEVQAVKHVKGQNHLEFNGLVSLRWLPFFWDKLIDTSTAFGVGLSYATERPPFEKDERGNSQVLMYLQGELELGLPAFPRWKVACRIHHRSGMFGTFENMWEASNAVCLGVRYRF